MPWAIMDQAVGLPTLNACFIDGTFFSFLIKKIKTQEIYMAISFEQTDILASLEALDDNELDTLELGAGNDMDLNYRHISG
jgi:hypothetical protein